MRHRPARIGIFILALAVLAPTLVTAQTYEFCPIAGCRTQDRFNGGNATYCPNCLNENLGDWGSIFLDADTPGCEDHARHYLKQKLVSQNASAPSSWQQWLNGGDLFFMTAAALRLGAKGMLTPEIHTQVKTAIASYQDVLGPNGTCNNNNGNSCMDNHTVAAAGWAWASAYLAFTGDTAGGRTATSLAASARTSLKKSFSQTESVCVHPMTFPYTVCTQCNEFNEAQAADLQSKIANNQAEVLTIEHNILNPNYGLGLLPLVSIALHGLERADALLPTNEAYNPSHLDRVIAHGLFRTGQFHLYWNWSTTCGTNWWNTCPRIHCNPGSSCTTCNSSNLNNSSCAIPNCASESCADFGYKPGMYSVKQVTTTKFALPGGPALIATVDPTASYYQFDDFCPSHFTTDDGFFHDGRRAAYYDFARVWPWASPQRALATYAADATAPQIHVDVPSPSQTISGTTTFSGWAFDAKGKIQPLSFTLDGQPISPPNYAKCGWRSDVCQFFGITTRPSVCPVGWSVSFVPPAGLTAGSHVFGVRVTDEQGNVTTFNRTFVYQP